MCVDAPGVRSYHFPMEQDAHNTQTNSYSRTCPECHGARQLSGIACYRCNAVGVIYTDAKGNEIYEDLY